MKNKHQKWILNGFEKWENQGQSNKNSWKKLLFPCHKLFKNLQFLFFFDWIEELMLNHFQYVIVKIFLPCCNKKNLIFLCYIQKKGQLSTQNMSFRKCLSFFSFDYRFEQIYFVLMPLKLTSLDVNVNTIIWVIKHTVSSLNDSLMVE